MRMHPQSGVPTYWVAMSLYTIGLSHATAPLDVREKVTFAPDMYTLPHDKAVAHAFRVASGLESMVLGEPQILGQMKQAVRTAEAAGSLGLVLAKPFPQSLLVGKKV